MSIILAKIFGLYFFAIGVAFLIDPERLKKMVQQILKDEKFIFLSGIIALLIGAFVVSVHNSWKMGWPLIITIIGWWSVIKGFALLIYPKFIDFFAFLQNRSHLFYQVLGAVYLLLGLFLTYQAHW